MRKLDEKKQKSIWLRLRTWRALDKEASKKGLKAGSLVREILEKHVEASR